MKFDLKDKKVLITGSSGGIGLALSKKFIEMNAQIIFTSSNEIKLNELKKKFGSDHLYYLLDLSDLENLQINIDNITSANKDIRYKYTNK